MFATCVIKEGEEIAEWSGEYMTESELSKLPADRHSNCVQVGPDVYLVPSTIVDADYVNHSCEPNAGLRGTSTLVAMRDIEPDEEIAYDYAMTDTSAYDQFTCRCGAINCRRSITGNDWRIPELRTRYRGYFSSYLEELIRSEEF